MRFSDLTNLTDNQKNKIILNLWRLPTVYEETNNQIITTDTCPTCVDSGFFNYKNKKYECDCTLQKLLQKRYLVENIGRKYHTLYLDDFIGKDAKSLIKTIESYVDDLDYNLSKGIGITFTGDLGTGKSMALCIVGKYLVREGVSFYFTTFDDLINAAANTYRDEGSSLLENRLKTVQVLGLDEFKTDARNVNGFLSQIAERIIRFRTDNNLPTIVTTNLTSEDEMKEFEKTHSLLSEKNIRIKTIGEDIRGSIIRERNMTKNREERKPIW